MVLFTRRGNDGIEVTGIPRRLAKASLTRNGKRGRGVASLGMTIMDHCHLIQENVPHSAQSWVIE